MDSTLANDNRKLPILKMEGINKYFGENNVQANSDVNFSLFEGEIHALVGENGAGKSTLMKILCGLENPSSGTIRIRGREVKIGSTADATRQGLGMVHQQFTLINEFTVADNVVLMREPRKGFFLYDVKKSLEEVDRAAKKYGLSLNPSARVGSLSVGEKQRVEILRVLYHGSDILVLDEPTSLLTRQEVKNFFQILKQLKAKGYTMIIITHKLEEVAEISDRVTVMRNGRTVGTDLTKNLQIRDIAAMMVGKEVLLQVDKPPVTPGKAVLETKSLEVVDFSCPRPLLREINLTVREGEILGLAGVAGNGLGELEDLLTGMIKKDEIKGEILLLGKNILGLHPYELRKAGMAYVPADRLHRGSSLSLTLAENIIAVDHHSFIKYGVMKTKKIFSFVAELIGKYDIKGSHNVKIGTLSGGNIQRALLSREMNRDPKLLVVSEPTWGLDINSTEYVYKKILEMREKGTAIVLISSNLDEVLALSDKIAVMYRGEIVGLFSNKNLDREFLGAYMLGLKRESVNQQGSGR